MTDSITWALTRLEQFEADAAPVALPGSPGIVAPTSYRPTATTAEVLKQAAIVERILDQYTPAWREEVPQRKSGYRFRTLREATQRGIAVLQARDEIEEHLSDRGPSLDGKSLHPWIWEAAQSAWNAGLFEDAVDAAARGLNSRTRAKVSRRDLGEGDLLAQLLSMKGADQDNPRLRLPLPAGTGEKTEKAIHSGVAQYGQGLFSAVRNPLAHEAPGYSSMTETEALEALAAFSLLARWVDRAEVRRG